MYNIWEHWKGRMEKLGAPLVDILKSIWKATAKPLNHDTHQSWKDVIRQTKVFPNMHVFLRLCFVDSIGCRGGVRFQQASDDSQ